MNPGPPRDGPRYLWGDGRIQTKVDRGGGFATSRECHEVLGCTRKVH